MTRTQWFCEQLSNSMTGFVWAVECISTEHWHSFPPRPSWLGQWTVTKAWQHTLEHTHDVLRLHLFWDAAAYLDAYPEEIH